MSDKTLIEWNADVGTRFLTIHPDGSFDIDKDAPPLFVIGELAKAFIRQQDRIKRLEEESESRWMLAQSAIGSCAEMSSRIQRLEEAGDAIMAEPCEYTFEQWLKAKEDKP